MFSVVIFIKVPREFESFKIDIRFFFIDLKSLVKSTFCGWTWIVIVGIWPVLQKVLIYRFMFPNLKVVNFLIWLSFRTVR